MHLLSTIQSAKMKIKVRVAFFLMFAGFSFLTAQTDSDLLTRANELAQKFIIVDTHIDVPIRLVSDWEDVSRYSPGGEFDYPRAVKGGLNAAFMSIYIPPRLQGTGKEQQFANELIDTVENIVNRNPDKFALATSVADVTKNFENGLLSLCMGMENGAPITDYDQLKHFYERGIRYVTLTHGKWNLICDSSYDEERKWNGLSPYGKEVVRAMNEIGIMIDVSHVTDSTFFQVMEITKVPVIASHSSCRSFTPGWERNISDHMIKALGKNGGVVQVNFGSEFLTQKFRDADKEYRDHVDEFMNEHKLKRRDSAVVEYRNKYRLEHPKEYADVSDFVDHIDHIVDLVGIDHVGIGSDFDGLGDQLPTGLKDVSMYPNIIYELLKREYSEEEIEKICSGNLLRVWREVENYANIHN